MSRLRSQNFQAYLVGGAVRDLLLDGRPKDFDVATDATPEEVHALFRNSRIIGRRFRIVHVRFGPEIIEVTTFRGHHDSEEEEPKDNSSRRSEAGLLLRDNVYGSLEEDAVRRDLTVNALYYDSGTFEVYDHVHGLEDLEDRLVAVIGEPEQRFREDPVRMLRVLRFAAKLDFQIEGETADAIEPCASLLGHIPAARLFDEFLKLFLSGNARPTLDLLLAYGLFNFLFPATDLELDHSPTAMHLLEAATENTDRRIAEGKTVTPAFILAALLWPAVQQVQREMVDRGEPPVPSMHNAAQQVLSEQVQVVAIPRRFSQMMREIWEFQLRLTRTGGKKPLEMLAHKRFRAAYDFLLLREQAGEDCAGLGQFWTDLQEQHPDIKPIRGEPDEPRSRRPRRRRRPEKP